MLSSGSSGPFWGLPRALRRLPGAFLTAVLVNMAFRRLPGSFPEASKRPKIAPQRPPRGQDCPTKAPKRHQDAAQTSYGASRRLCYRCYVGSAESSLRSHKNRPPSEPSSHHVAAMLRLCRLISHNLFHLQPCRVLLERSCLVLKGYEPVLRQKVLTRRPQTATDGHRRPPPEEGSAVRAGCYS